MNKKSPSISRIVLIFAILISDKNGSYNLAHLFFIIFPVESSEFDAISSILGASLHYLPSDCVSILKCSTVEKKSPLTRFFNHHLGRYVSQTFQAYDGGYASSYPRSSRFLMFIYCTAHY